MPQMNVIAVSLSVTYTASFSQGNEMEKYECVCLQVSIMEGPIPV